MNKLIFKPKGVKLPDNFIQVLCKITATYYAYGFGITHKHGDAVTSIRKLFDRTKSDNYALTIMQQLTVMKINDEDEVVINIYLASVPKDSMQPFFINKNHQSAIPVMDIQTTSRMMPSVMFTGCMPIWTTYTNYRNVTYPANVEFVTEFLANKNILEIILTAPEMFELIYSNFFATRDTDGMHMIILYPKRDAYVFGERSFYTQNGLLYCSKPPTIEESVKRSLAPLPPTKNLFTIKKKYGTFLVQPSMAFTVVHDRFRISLSSFVKKGINLTVKSRGKPKFKLSTDHFLCRQTNNLQDTEEMAKLILIPRPTNLLAHPLTDKKFKIIKAFETGLLIESLDASVKKWISPIELTYNFNINTPLVSV